MNLTGFQKKLVWGVGILSIISLWIVFPLIFKVLIDAYKLPDDFKDLGPFGDIYGSLNTLISSIALCAVAFSTYLQVTSIRETRETNTKQLNLAKEAHDEQVKESRNAIFANKFYSLLNFKESKLNSVVLSKIKETDPEFPEYEEVSGLKAMEDLALEFHEIMSANKNVYANYYASELLDDFEKAVDRLGYNSINLLISYFHIYIDLLNLINTSNISENEINFYKSVLSNSMYQYEQVVFFWISPMFGALDLRDSEIFTMFGYLEEFEVFALQFHDISHFKYDEWKNVFLEYGNPA
ncbi:hypothetical protein ACK0BW_08015 [Acinetobacter baumannii]|uniref:hypothetical protein n=1 Tax=Acinetobacter baumannii TaxID=470 RepID=UPI0020233969|nr:hypothetical protein [Acinetobacter baumannii]MCL8264112.1 hypothetical protein [Acinetobacter baumannii]